MALQRARRRFTVDEYYRMGRTGILKEGDRVELIGGEIVQMPPIGPGHAANVARCTQSLVRRFSDVANVTVQNPVRLDKFNEPVPDLALLRLRSDFYAERHPLPQDVLLLVEVADTTLGIDRRVKVPLYARAGIPEVWLLDVRRRPIYVYRDPSGGGYQVTLTVRPGESLNPLAFPDRAFDVAELLG
jgi:Uma2 family endonuclease